MTRTESRNLFLISPLIITIVYCASIVIWSQEILGKFLEIMHTYAFIVTTIWVFMGAILLINNLVRQSMDPDRVPLSEFFSRIVHLARRPSVQIISLTPPLILILLMSAYGLFKQVMIPESGYWAGPLIAQYERQLLLGHDAWQLTHALLPWGASYWLDQAYQAWMVLMAGSMLLCSYLSGDPAHRSRFMTCFIANWVITGTALAYLFPAAGPIYLAYFHGLPDQFAALKASLAAEDVFVRAQHGAGILSLKSQALLLSRFESGTVAAGGGISAMPSMHNAVAVLLACASFEVNRWLGWLMTLFASVIFVGSIHLGWHYALDGIVAAAISCGLWLSSGILLKRYECREAQRRNRPGGRRKSDPQPSIEYPAPTKTAAAFMLSTNAGNGRIVTPDDQRPDNRSPHPQRTAYDDELQA